MHLSLRDIECGVLILRKLFRVEMQLSMKMLSFAKESVVSSTSIGDQEHASRKVEIEVETVAAQGGVADKSSREVQTATSINQSQVEDDYSIARDYPRREIRRPACYVDSEELVVMLLQLWRRFLKMLSLQLILKLSPAQVHLIGS